MALDQLAIYNGALQLIGSRRLASLNEDREPRYELDEIWDASPAYYCAELTKPLFATKLVKLDSPTTSTEHDYEYVHTLPSGYVDIVSLHQDGKLDQRVERFVRDGNTILCELPVVYLRYVEKSLLDTLTNWNASFTRLVMAYMAFELAERIKPDALDKVSQVYQERIKIVIDSNQGDEPIVRPVNSASDDFKLSLYNNALIAASLPRLKSLTDDSSARYDLDAIWALNPHLYSAELVKPRFATKTVQLSMSVESDQHELDNIFNLPDNFVELVGVFSDPRLDQPVARFIREGDTLACEYQTIYVRYIDGSLLDDYTNWTQTFTRVVYNYIAKLLTEHNPEAANRLEFIEQQFTTALSTSVASEGADEPATRSKKSTFTLTPEWLAIYNDALLMLGEDHLVNVDDDSQRRSILDICVNAGVVEAVLEDIGWHWAITSMRITSDPALETEWGYQYAHHLPTDLHRFDGVWYDEYMQTPIKHYTDEAGVLMCNVDEIFIKYVSSEWLKFPEKWKPSFKRYIAAKIAYDTMNRFPAADKNAVIQAHDQRKRDVRAIDAQQSPPRLLTRGNWTRTRSMGGPNRGRP